MRCGVLVFGLVLGGCHAQGASAPPAPRSDLPSEEQLEALVIPPTGGQVTIAECPYDADSIPPIDTIKDVRLPEFEAGRNRASNWENGDEWRDDVELSENMAPVQAEILRCLDLAACYVESDALVGEIAMELEVTPEGRVRAATFDVTDQLAVEPVLPCTRRAIAELEFPRIDGGNTFVSYAMTIE
ncbi:MAG: hypothetical protein AAF721_20165 [Myxococcota bacterium]